MNVFKTGTFTANKTNNYTLVHIYNDYEEQNYHKLLPLISQLNYTLSTLIKHPDNIERSCTNNTTKHTNHNKLTPPHQNVERKPAVREFSHPAPCDPIGSIFPRSAADNRWTRIHDRAWPLVFRSLINPESKLILLRAIIINVTPFRITDRNYTR